MTAISPPLPTLPAADLGRARKFYEDVLGARFTDERAGGVTYELAGGPIWLYETPSAGTARNTQVAWFVDDIEADVADLQAKGVSFETFEAPDVEWDGVIASAGGLRSAWFHDTEGNTLCIDQRV
jgi:catechol 2,3-dioxygenase-like lactoylglutathione lyase family enzyme